MSSGHMLQSMARGGATSKSSERQSQCGSPPCSIPCRSFMQVSETAATARLLKAVQDCTKPLCLEGLELH